MPNPTRVLLWTDAPAPYTDAIAAADLAERVAIEALARKDMPTQAQRADTEAMLARAARDIHQLRAQLAKVHGYQVIR